MPELGPSRFGQMLPGREYVKQSELEPDSSTASEYGGVDALIQPPPHDVAGSPNEQLMLLYNTDPDDRTGTSGMELLPQPTAVKPGSPSKQKAPTKSWLIQEYGG